MKTIITAIIFLVLSLSLYSQTDNNSYLDFFGKKYEFKNSITLTESKIFISSQKEPFKYRFCGKHFLNKNETKHIDNEKQNYFIKKIVYNISNCLDFYNVVDSVKISSINKDLDFKIVNDKNNYKILGFKVFADSVDYEITYGDIHDNSGIFKTVADSFVYIPNNSSKQDLKNYMMFDLNSIEAKNQLISIFDELKNCSKLILTGMYYFDKKDNQEYFISMDILLYR